jgi:hypothetical protein
MYLNYWNVVDKNCHSPSKNGGKKPKAGAKTTGHSCQNACLCKYSKSRRIRTSHPLGHHQPQLRRLIPRFYYALQSCNRVQNPPFLHRAHPSTNLKTISESNFGSICASDRLTLPHSADACPRWDKRRVHHTWAARCV